MRTIVVTADIIRRVYEVNPLLCDRCGGQLQVIGFIPERHFLLSRSRYLELLPGRN